MRYPRTSINGSLRIGTMPSAVVCTGEGWDNLTDTRRKRQPKQAVSSAPARKRDRAREMNKEINMSAVVSRLRGEWEAAEMGAAKRTALAKLRQAEIRAGYRDASGQAVAIEYMGETWANNA